MKKFTFLKSNLLLIILFFACFGLEAQNLILRGQSDIDNCTITDVQGRLYIYNSSSDPVTDISSLSVQSTTRGVYIRNCTSLTNLNGLRNISFTNLSLSGLSALSNLNEFEYINQTSLTSLSLSSNSALTSLEGIQYLTSLTS